MGRKIGEIFKFDGEWYQCVKSNGTCDGCAGKFQPYSFCKGFEDCTGRIFKKLEKVGEPYDDCGTILQRFKIYTNVTNADTKGLELHIYSNDTIGIEIKQNKEDMEEKKQKLDDLVGLYSSAQITYKEFDKELKSLYTKQGEEDKPVLKSFNLEEAKEGKPVCTRNGRKARIICFDRKHLYYQGHDYPIVALIDEGSYAESVGSYTKDGLSVPGKCYDKDLMMLPEKKEG